MNTDSAAPAGRRGPPKPLADRSIQSFRTVPAGAGRVRAAVLRALALLGFWLLLAAPDLAAVAAEPTAAVPDLFIALSATVVATWVSVWLWPPRPQRLRVGPLLLLGWRFLVQSVTAGIDVARRVLDPRLPVQPGLVVYRPRLRNPHQQSVLATLSSAAPGSLAVGTDADGNLIYHVLDTRLPIADGLAEDERLLLRAYGQDGERAGR